LINLNHFNRKLRFNRITRFLLKKRRVSSLDACTWWAHNSSSRIIEENNYKLHSYLSIKSLDNRSIPECLTWANPIISRPRFIYKYQNVIISPIESHIYFVDLNRSTIDLGAKFDCDHISIFDFYPRNNLLKAKQLHGNVLHLGISSSSNNFWHWMHEVFARLIRVKKEYDFEFFDYIILPNMSKQFQHEAINLLNIKQERIISKERFYRCCDNLYTLNIDNVQSSLDLKHFFHKVVDDKKEVFKNVFLDRDINSGVHNRVLNNFKSHRDLYKQAGFKFIFPEKLSLIDQAKIFLGAESIVGTSGAAFTLAGLMNPNSNVVEILSKSWIDPAISNNCAAAELNYGFYVENSYRPDKYDEKWSRNRSSDISIDANQVNHEAIIDFLLNY